MTNCFEQFLLLSQCFQELSAAGCGKGFRFIIKSFTRHTIFLVTRVGQGKDALFLSHADLIMHFDAFVADDLKTLWKKQNVQMLIFFFMPPESPIRWASSFWPVCLCLSVEKNFNLDHFFWTITGTATIFHMCIPCDMTFLSVAKCLTLRPWPLT